MQYLILGLTQKVAIYEKELLICLVTCSLDPLPATTDRTKLAYT